MKDVTKTWGDSATTTGGERERDKVGSREVRWDRAVVVWKVGGTEVEGGGGRWKVGVERKGRSWFDVGEDWRRV